MDMSQLQLIDAAVSIHKNLLRTGYLSSVLGKKRPEKKQNCICELSALRMLHVLNGLGGGSDLVP